MAKTLKLTAGDNTFDRDYKDAAAKAAAVPVKFRDLTLARHRDTAVSSGSDWVAYCVALPEVGMVIPNPDGFTRQVVSVEGLFFQSDPNAPGSRLVMGYFICLDFPGTEPITGWLREENDPGLEKGLGRGGF